MFCNHKGTKIRVCVSEIKTVFNSINCEFFCQCYRFPTKSGDPARTDSQGNSFLEFVISFT